MISRKTTQPQLNISHVVERGRIGGFRQLAAAFRLVLHHGRHQDKYQEAENCEPFENLEIPIDLQLQSIVHVVPIAFAFCCVGCRLNISVLWYPKHEQMP